MNVVIGPKWCVITPMVRILVLSVFIGNFALSLRGFLIQVAAVCVIFMAVLKKFEPDIFCKLVLPQENGLP